MPTPKAGESKADFLDRCIPMVTDEGRDNEQAVAMCNSMFEKGPMNMKNKKPIIAMSAPVTVTAAQTDGDKKTPAKFDATFYTGGALDISGWDIPVIVDLSGLDRGNVLVANLDHKPNQRVGNFEVTNDGKSLVAHGTATAKTAAREEVIGSAEEGYQWQASLEVNPSKIDEIPKGKSVKVNGQEFTGPLYVTRKGTLKGFAFVSHGADDNTTVSIAAIAASSKEKTMKAECKQWIEAMGFAIDDLTPTQLDAMESNYDGRQLKPSKKPKFDEGIEAKQAEADRVEAVTEIALNACDKRPYDIKAIKEMGQRAIDEKWTIDKFRLELLEAALPPAHTVFRTKQDARLSSRVIEAAICMAGRLDGHEKMFDEQTLDAAHSQFKNGIGLKQLYLLAAEANGYRASYANDITIDVQRAAFGMTSPQQIRAQGWSTIDIATIISNTANKFIMRGWNMVDRTCLNIAKIQSVRDFKTATTVSLTDSVIYEKIGAAGEIPHGTLDEITYTVKADTYAKMLAITRQDIINDDLGALTDVPMKLGNGAIKKLNDIFWTEYLGLVGANFFGTGNTNINTGVADMSIAGLTATEVVFMAQTNPDGTPLGVLPQILLVPTALKAAALNLMNSEKLIDGTATAKQGDANVFRGRFTVESSPYISNTTYSGSTSTGYWMLANPNELPVIAIAALNGRVEPTVETADADFNVLGVQMRGYSDVGVNDQEHRGGVYADGTT